MRTTLLALLLLLTVAVAPAFCVCLADGGQPLADIVLAPGATPAEQTAAHDLAAYLEKISGAKFAIVERPGRIFAVNLMVGRSENARLLGFDQDKLGPEEWVVTQKGPYIILTGGRPRGTLYAVYHFLEDVMGVHWWNPWEETVPQKKSLYINIPDLRGKPVIPYRDIYMLYGNDGGRFAARNRLNRDGDARIKPEFGGCRDYGPPYHVHTSDMYFPAKEYGAAHPEWFSLIGGKRLTEDTQMCWTNMEMRQALLAKLTHYIETTSAQAKQDGVAPPDVFSVSQNDRDNHCQCDKCEAIAKAEESEMGPLLDAINWLADQVKDKYPWVYIDTLAYQYTQKAPKTMKPRDNVIIRLCDTESDPTKPITSEDNKAFREHLLSWAAIAKNLRVWDYAVTYANPVGMPLPSMQTYAPDYKFYTEHNVEGVFTEHEFGIIGDMRDLKIWMMIKLLENPYADYDKLVKTFTDGFYGPAAGKLVREYVAALEAEAKAKGTHANWGATPMSLTYLNLGFINRAQALFDQAEKAVGTDEVLLRQVRHARLPLDRASVIAYTRLNSEWQALGRPADQMPPDRDLTARRVMDTWIAQSQLRMDAAGQAREKAEAEKEMRRYTSLPSSVSLPAKFRDLPKGTVFDYTADMTRNWNDVVKVIKAPDAESGFTNKLDLASPDTPQAEKYVLPMPWGLYGVQQKKFVGGNAIKAEDITGPGYHWYKMGTFPIEPSYYAYFFWSWIIQIDIDNAYDAGKPDQTFDVWASMKFTGPRFPHAQPGDTDAIYVERVVLVKAQQPMLGRVLTALLFDLDQTLYAPQTGLLQAGDCRITDYLAHRLGLPREHADAERRRLWREYGTTARGAEIEYGLPQRELYIHSLEDLDPAEYLCRDEPLEAMLSGLAADLFVVTNSAANYAHRVLAALGIDHCFRRVFDIEALDWCPKPEHSAYRCVLAAIGRPADEVGMVEDFPWNLVPARELGMFTIYLGTDEAEAHVRLEDLLHLPEALSQAGVELRSAD